MEISMLEKFGKSLDTCYENYLTLFSDATEYTNLEAKIDAHYVSGPSRDCCPVCASTSGSEIQIVRNRTVPYSVCGKCGHLYGRHIDTFEDFLYVDESNYNDNYIDSDIELFEKRVNDVYVPKVDFLFEGLEEQLEDISQMKFLDVGTGVGHFISGLEKKGITPADQIEFDYPGYVGIEPIKKSIDVGKAHGVKGLQYLPADETNSYLSDAQVDVVSMICVLPHLKDMHETLLAISKNPNIKYVYQKLPMLSLRGILDLVVPNTSPRVITGAHSHIFTLESVEFLEKKYGFVPVARWWFGQDALDLEMKLTQLALGSKETESVAPLIEKYLHPLFNEIQSSFDSNRMSSELHVLWKKSK